MRRIVLLFVLLRACAGPDPVAPAVPTTTAPPASVTDTFERSVGGSWGEGPLGAWTFETSSGAPLALAVDGGAGVASSESGENKGLLLVGSPRSGTTRVVVVATVNRRPAEGTPNHWHVVVRASGLRTYYSAYLLPGTPGKPAELVVLAAKNGEFTTPATVALPFAVRAGSAYSLELLVRDAGATTVVRARAWPAGETAPGSWQAVWTDRAEDRILSGRVGVRVSIYASPASVAVDQVSVSES